MLIRIVLAKEHCHRRQTHEMWCKCLIECTFLQSSERANERITIACGFERRRGSYPATYPQSMWATFSIREPAPHKLPLSVMISKALLHGYQSAQKRIVTMCNRTNRHCPTPNEFRDQGRSHRR